MTEARNPSNGDLDEALLDFPPAERHHFAGLVARLRARPLPPPRLRAGIRSELAERGSPSAVSLRLAVSYIVCGGLLLTVAALGVAGIGPLTA
jgi:hypothetical protein